MLQEIRKMIRYQLGLINKDDVNRSGKLCLLYHGITKSDCGQLNKRHTTAKVFNEQLTRLAKYYSFVSVQDYFQDTDLNRKKPLLALTFDDGYANNLEVALPILKKHRAPATIYLTGLNLTGFPIIWADFLDLWEPNWRAGKIKVDDIEFTHINNRFITTSNGQGIRDVIRYSRPDWGFKKSLLLEVGHDKIQLNKIAANECWRLLTDEQICSLSKEPLLTLGSHGFYHNNLASLNKDDLQKELIQSIDYLKSLTGKSVNHIAFPDGSYNEYVKKVCLELGLCFQVAAEGFRCENDLNDPNLIDRKGLYNCGRPHSQLFDIYR